MDFRSLAGAGHAPADAGACHIAPENADAFSYTHSTFNVISSSPAFTCVFSDAIT